MMNSRDRPEAVKDSSAVAMLAQERTMQSKHVFMGFSGCPSNDEIRFKMLACCDLLILHKGWHPAKCMGYSVHAILAFVGAGLFKLIKE
tara:strand:+ start:410 stop:676 length:267 start_codon:yes stop_codon:yes gene_type:complete